jgi:predicted lipid-binding transport protein (Tim44 family)
MTRGRGKAFFGGLLGGLAGALLAPRLRGLGRGVLPGQFIRNTLGLHGASRRFAGTPCSQEPAEQEAGRPDGAAEAGAAARPPDEEGKD